MVQIQAKSIKNIQLGHRGENEARQIIFDLAEYINIYGPGTARLLHQRDGDPAPYIVPAVQSDDTLTWTVTDEDTAAPGTGSAELQWMVDSVLAKSDIWHTKTKAALDDGSPEPPTGTEGWYQQLIVYIDSLRGEGVSEEQIAAAVEAYLLEHPVDVPVDSVNGKTGAVQLTAADVKALSMDDLQTGVDAALAKAKASGEFDGPQGDPGTDGGYYTPSVDGDGNLSWAASKSDMPAVTVANIKGAPGDNGTTPTIGDNGNWYLGDTDTGKPSRGDTGKSAYQYAQEGGFTGTEAEFSEKMAEEMPDKLPNPNALTFTGAVNGTYDGSAPVSVEIPTLGGTGEREWAMLADVDIAEIGGSTTIELTDLDNFTEFFIKWASPKNESETPSGYDVYINGTLFGQLIPILKENGSSSYGYVNFRYNGLVWLIQKSSGAVSETNITVNAQNGLFPYNLPLGVGASTKIRVTPPVAQYRAVSGNIIIYGR